MRPEEERGYDLSAPKKENYAGAPPTQVSGLMYTVTVIGMILVSFAFSVTLLLVAQATDGAVEDFQEKDWYKYCSYLLYQALYLLVILAYVFVFRKKPREFGYRKTHWKYFLIAIVLQIGLLFSLDWLNSWFIDFLGLFGYEASSSSLPSMETAGGFVGVLVVVALLPAVLEETIFRGVILSGMKLLGTTAACLLGGLCFSLFHQSPEQTLYQFVCGACFTLLAIRADSLFPTMLGHFFNNALILFNEKFGFLALVGTGGEIAIYVASAVCLAASVVYLIFFDRRTDAGRELPLGSFVKPAAPGLAVCGIMWVYVLVTGLL